MAKEKKRGFFSWLGLGRQSEEPAVEPLATEKEGVTEQEDVIEQTDVIEPIDVIEPTVEHVISEKTTEAQVEDDPVEAELHEQVAAVIPTEPNSATMSKGASNTLPESAVAESVDIGDNAAIAHNKVVEPTTQVTEAGGDLSLVKPVAEGDTTEQGGTTDNLSERSLTEDNLIIDVPTPQAVVEESLVDVFKQPTEVEEKIIPVAVQEQERPTKEGFFARLKRSLIKTKQNLGSGFMGLFSGKKIDDDLFEELEEQLLIADVGVETTRKIITSLTEHASRKQLKDADALYGKLKEEMSEILSKVDKPLDVSGKSPYVILMVGVNGVGKTTTIGKLARQFQAEGKSVMLAAGDTFRAAAVEQLQVWGERNKIAVVAQHTGADSASVIFDAIQAAKARGIDVLLADTAGRLQNKAHLMEELKKIVRVMKKLDGDAPHEVMLTLDASTGQNAVSQAKLFNEAVGLTGITLTKLDGTAKGGVIFAIADQFEIPIRYIGVGEGIEDLRPFKADEFIEALFARED
ncbi:signal recognition particle-docking protein FtsY [Yersinia similis]|uniref:signal recognition particle-docking protein FtsY n=1 Tax=Yersinia similis TaxID=367190 RepID=UPI0005DB9CB8|nr:signal recognition particle-docking protein FtsY [Yersinia similis]CFQ55417.1 cell division protein [Yersinia similis]